MAWLDEATDRLTAQPVCGYQRKETPMVEPTALAASALLAADRGKPAARALDWLLAAQAADGSLGIDAETRQPGWPTGWAVLAWNAAAQKNVAPKNAAPKNAAPKTAGENIAEKNIAGAKPEWLAAARRAVAWLLSVSGRPVKNGDDQMRFLGHDTMLQGWPWVVGTHSWVEPTAINVLALRSAGQAAHPRCREAIKLLLDRQLPHGGWNYGNTTLFGNEFRPLVQSTGLALAALADELEIRPKVQRSLDYLHRTISESTTTVSLCYAMLGLAGFGAVPPAADRWLAAAWRRTLKRGGSPYNAALLVLAGKRIG